MFLPPKNEVTMPKGNVSTRKTFDADRSRETRQARAFPGNSNTIVDKQDVFPGNSNTIVDKQDVFQEFKTRQQTDKNLSSKKQTR